MLKRDILSERSATSIRLKKFGLALKASPLSLSRADQLIFLCGANARPNVPSARREALKKFIQAISPRYRVVYAEAVFNELAKIGSNRKNVLDLEHEISNIADKIVVVLESPSAFCELGAFAHPALRDKLVVINDSRFQSESSFINTGPIAAMLEAQAKVLWYPMAPNGLTVLDGIGATFNDLRAALHPRLLPGSKHVEGDIANLAANKPSLYFVHDLVLFTGPVTHEELILVLIQLFGDKSYDILKRLLGVLRSAGLVQSHEIGKGTWVYRADSAEPYLTYSGNISALTASFRVNHLKNNPRRFSYA